MNKKAKHVTDQADW